MAYPGKTPAPRDDAAVVDRLLKQLGRTADPAPGASPRPGATSVPRAGRFSVDQKPFSLPGRGLAGTGPIGVWVRVSLGVFLGVAVTLWPYERGCGWWLLFYLVAVAVVVVTGAWGALFSWNSRRGAAHLVALATILWGTALEAHEVLSRVGPTTAPAVWRCAEPRAAAPVGGSSHGVTPRADASIAARLRP